MLFLKIGGYASGALAIITIFARIAHLVKVSYDQVTSNQRMVSEFSALSAKVDAIQASITDLSCRLQVIERLGGWVA